MKLKTVVGVSLLLVVSVGRQAFGAEEGDTRDKAQRSQVLSKVIDAVIAARGTAKMSVDVEEEDYLAVKVTNRTGEEIVLEFEPDPTSATLRPILPEGTEQDIFGREFFGFGTELMRAMEPADSARHAQLLPFSAEVAEQPHDDVSVFIVNHQLVLISFWRQGERVGTYFAVDDGDAIADERVVSPDGADQDSPSMKPSRKKAVCDILFQVCLNQESEYWVFACGIWLYFCTSA